MEALVFLMRLLLILLVFRLTHYFKAPVDLCLKVDHLSLVVKIPIKLLHHQAVFLVNHKQGKIFLVVNKLDLIQALAQVREDLKALIAALLLFSNIINLSLEIKKRPRKKILFLVSVLDTKENE